MGWTSSGGQARGVALFAEADTPSSVKNLDVFRGTVTLEGTLQVVGDANFLDGGTQDGVLDVQVRGTQPGQFGQLIANGIDVGTGTTELRVRLTVDVTPVDLAILDNTSNVLTAGRFQNLTIDPSPFFAQGPGDGDTTPFFVDYNAGDGNATVIRRDSASRFPNRTVTPVID